MSIKVYDVRKFKRNPNEVNGIPTEFNSNKYKVNSEFLGNDFTATASLAGELSLKYRE